MAHQTKMTRDQILRELRTKSPRTYRKRLALAHHLKVTGNNPNLSNRFGPLEQEAGEMLAKTKFPLSPELKSQMEAGAFSPEAMANEPVEQETNEPESPEEAEVGNQGFDQLRGSFPRLTPPTPLITNLRPALSPELRMDEEAMDLPIGFQEQPTHGMVGDEMRKGFPRTTTSHASSTRRRNMPITAFSTIRPHAGKLIMAGAALACLLGLAAFFLVTPSYMGVLSDAKATRSGVILDLDGRYPAQKMSVWVTKNACLQLHGHWPQIGSHLKVIGKSSIYHGRPEIVVSDISQLIRQ